MQCVSNLRQIGVAFAQYESAHGMFPFGSSPHGGFLVSILPQIGELALYSRLNGIDGVGMTGVKTALAEFAVPLYSCPSDSASAVRQLGATSQVVASTSYAGNAGSGVQTYGYNGVFQHTVSFSVFPHLYPEGPVRAVDIRDGLSSTAAVCEFLHADGTFGNRLRVIWLTPNLMDKPSELDAFASVCGGIPPVPKSYGWLGDPKSRGTPWVDGDLGFAMYNHILPPNPPSCINQTDWQRGAFSAASSHRG